MTTTMHISHQKVKLYTVVNYSISRARAGSHGTYGLPTICSIHTIFLFVQGGGGGGDSCLFAAFRTTKISPTVGCQIFCLSCLILVVGTSETL